MKKRVMAICLLIVYIAVIAFLTLNGIPSKEEYREKYRTSAYEKR